jgi:transporter family-2 protein
MSLPIIALIAGACIAIQAAMNARLGVHFQSAWLATSYAFFASFALVTAFILQIQQPTVVTQLVQFRFTEIPWYLWCSPILSVIGVGSMYWLIPKVGVGTMMSCALTGQVIIAMFISHFGLFDSPQRLVSATKCVGSVLMIAGVVLVNQE